MANVLVEIFLLLLTAVLLGLGQLWVAVPMLAVMIARGVRLFRADSKGRDWRETLLAYLLPASAILCYRALENGYWF